MIKKTCKLNLLNLCLALLCINLLASIGCSNTNAGNGKNLNPSGVVSPSEDNPPTDNVMPIINIISKTGKNDFVEKPKSKVTQWGGGWGWGAQAPEPYYEDCTITVYDVNGKIDLSKVTGQVKVRGNWTTSYDKKPLKIKFDEKQSMLGLNNSAKFKKWVLTASYKDWSFLRDPTAYYMYKLIAPEYYTSDYQLVEVFVNGTYWGVYLLVEQQEAKKKRINITAPDDGYTGTDIGYLLEMDNYSSYEEDNFKFNMNYLHHLDDKNGDRIETSKLTSGYTIKSDIYDNAQTKFIENYMNNLWKICYEAVYEQKLSEFDDDYNLKEMQFDAAAFTGDAEAVTQQKVFACVSKVIDIDSLVATYILNEVCCDADIYWSSFYMDLDFGKNKKKLTFEAPWDFDSGLGNKRHCADAQGLYAGVSGYDVNYSQKGYANPWFIIFINCDWFQTKVKAKWQQIHNDDVLGKLTAQIDEVSTKYTTNFANNYARWNNIGNNASVGNELNSKSAACKTQKQSADYLKDWLNKRFNALDGLWLE